MMIMTLYFLLVQMVFLPQATLPHQDTDSDGIDDRLEQSFLEKFVPKFMLSAEECDALPAEFVAGKPVPQIAAKSGTIYGQVFPVVRAYKSGEFVEIHYYHLWSNDCGLNGHALDVEHVSALLSMEAPSDTTDSWKAEFWYAAAHEDTVCDASHGAGSSFIAAEQHGPTVWISKGKHASYLDREICLGGCSDDCGMMRPMNTTNIINLGEPGAPMNGAAWTGWQGWPLADKMQTDFPEKVLAKLIAAESPEIVPVNHSQAPVKNTIHISSSTAAALIDTKSKTGSALSSAGGAVGKSLEKSRTGTGNSLIRAFKAVWKDLGRSFSEDKQDEMKAGHPQR